VGRLLFPLLRAGVDIDGCDISGDMLCYCSSEGLCVACGTCADYCQFREISVDNSLARIDAFACMGCGVCVAHCPQEAISLLRDPANGEPLKIQTLITRAASPAQG
jgi:MinD superfamily P-loop ATPase